MKISKIDVRVLRRIAKGVEVGSEPCACGGCRPTATIYQGDPNYVRHDAKLAEGPCCCDRFFVVGLDAEDHARVMAAERRGAEAYRFDKQEVALPWGGIFPVVVGDFRT